MEASRLILQKSDATGYRRIYPRAATVDDVLAVLVGMGGLSYTDRRRPQTRCR